MAYFSGPPHIVRRVAARLLSTIRQDLARPLQAADEGDDSTNDLLVSNVIRTDEMQVWFIAEHLVDAPLVRADAPNPD
jgi:DNA-binding ferritin-like protein